MNITVAELTHCDAFQNMVQGNWYLTNDRTLSRYRAIVKQQCLQANNAQGEQKAVLMTSLMPAAKDVLTGCHFYCDYGVNIVAEHGFTAGDYLTILDAAPIHFGRNVRIGEGVSLAAVSHHENPQMRLQGWQKSAPIFIGDKVTIGNGTTILPGSIIPAGTDIPAGAVITRHTFA